MWSIYKHASSTTEAAPEMVFFKKGVVKNFAKFLLNKVPGLHVTLLKRRLRHRCFSVNFAKFLRTLFFTERLQATAFAANTPIVETADFNVREYQFWPAMKLIHFSTF